MTGPALRLRPTTPAEFDEWLPRQVANYTEMITESGSLAPAEARQKAERDTGLAFSAGAATQGQLLFRVLVGDAAVGWLWLGLSAPDGDPLMAWVYDVEIDPAYRGRGYGRAAMLLAEAEARSAGMTSIGLNVHGQNAVARSLYDSLGYAVMALQMKKPL